MSADGQLTVNLPPELVEQLAHRVAEILAERFASTSSAWLNADQAAEHLCCSRDRIHDLTALGKLLPRRDGRRLLFRRDDLDAYLEASA